MLLCPFHLVAACIIIVEFPESRRDGDRENLIVFVLCGLYRFDWLRVCDVSVYIRHILRRKY